MIAVDSETVMSPDFRLKFRVGFCPLEEHVCITEDRHASHQALFQTVSTLALWSKAPLPLACR